MLSLTILRFVALAGDLLEDGGDDAARAAPRRPEVDQHGLLGLEHLGLEVAVGHVLDVGHAWVVLSGWLASESIATGLRPAQLPASASSTRGVTQASTAAAARMIGIAIATVTNVAASSSFQPCGGSAIVHAASGRKSANSSGHRVRRRAPSSSSAGEMSSCADSVEAALPSAHACVVSENSVAAIDEADRQRAGLVVDPAPGAGVALGHLRQRRAGHEAGDAGEAVQREHEPVAVEDEAEVAERRRGGRGRGSRPA